MLKAVFGIVLFLVIVILVTLYFLSTTQHSRIASIQPLISIQSTRLDVASRGEKLLKLKRRQSVTTDIHNESQITIIGVDERAKEIFRKRRNAVRAVCKQTGRKKLGVSAPQMDDVYHHMIVDDKHKLIYCYVPKAACSSWKRVMLRLTGATDTRAPHERKNHLLMSDLPKSEREKRMKTYKKFMVHREPLGRLLSAYFDKFVRDDAMRLTFGRKIIYRYRSNPSRHSLKYGNDVTFREFARFVVDVAHKTRTIDMNEHWRSQVKLCQPCTVDYNYYSEMETVERDAEALLKIVGAPTHIKFPHSHKTNSAQNVTQFYGDLGKNLILKLLAVYREDVAIFGYNKFKVY
ncbi:carbohydrate sulfotransferase 14-like [Corticium candelabrum]|uniref:carbohydrate sulfotransferase 14-like n=1 Tax=Corticium candelabrum TaxID=121492 RepID=UPI002E265036|nr:carbohydrate sulfotransferase 14-like [Corticium candelabrum]